MRPTTNPQSPRRSRRHLHTDHTEIRLDAADALKLVPDIAEWFDEPFADSSQLPTYLVARETRKHVTVALSGDGGDELFAGYPKYAWLDGLWRAAGRIAATACVRLAGSVLSLAPEAASETDRSDSAGCRARRAHRREIAAAWARLAGLQRGPSSAGSLPASASTAISCMARTHGYRLTPLAALDKSLPDLVSRMQVNDIATYLPDDILTKVDRCTMAVSLEAREPLLDHRLIEFVWSLPRDVHHAGGPKGLLRAVLGRYIPPAWMDRPKRGFSVPLAQWLRGPLRGWAHELLEPTKLKQDGAVRRGGSRAAMATSPAMAARTMPPGCGIS